MPCHVKVFIKATPIILNMKFSDQKRWDVHLHERLSRAARSESRLLHLGPDDDGRLMVLPIAEYGGSFVEPMMEDAQAEPRADVRPIRAAAKAPGKGSPVASPSLPDDAPARGPVPRPS